MIGQEKLRKLIGEQIEAGEYPRFSIIVGPEGSGKKTLTMSIAFALECNRIFVEPKVDAVREMIHDAYTVSVPTMYVVKDGNLSMSARESLLKICEETPKSAYICLLISDVNMVTETLKSRAGVYYMQPYKPNELVKYSENYGKSHADAVADICETPGDVDNLCTIGSKTFYNFVEKVVNNIADVSPANALKMTESIDIKGNDPDKYDLALFLRAFKAICGNGVKKAVAEDDTEGQMWYSAGVRVATESLSQMKVSGINKSALLDMFILNIRKEWGE